MRAFGEYKTLIDAGIPVLPNADWLETTPLGKAEWVKLMGALTDREELVEPEIRQRGASLSTSAAIGTAAAVRPSVIIGMPFKGTWYTPAGGSYMAQFLRDAGATIIGRIPKAPAAWRLTFETVAPVALTAEFWLDVGDVEFQKRRSFPRIRVTVLSAPFDPTRSTTITGGSMMPASSDYWESGAVNPQWVLADLIRILHPGALPADTLIYYKQIK